MGETNSKRHPRQNTLIISLKMQQVLLYLQINRRLHCNSLNYAIFFDYPLKARPACA